MVIALYLIAFAMIAGGGWAAFQGYGIILNERGWTMVIAGTVAATGGFLLLGAAVIAGRLKRIEREAVRLRERAGRLETAPTPPGAMGADLAEIGRATSGGMSAGASVPRTDAPSRRGEPVVARTPAKDEPIEHAVLKAADVIPEPSSAPASGPQAAHGGGASAVSSEPPSVVGTYNSGGNSYVMYSDGSIEADTPNGRFSFNSLDELKEFISSGGEEGTGTMRP